MTERDALKAVLRLVGTQSKLAEALGVRQAQVSVWLNRDGRVPPQYAIPCHRLTNGEVTAHDLRPDLYPKGVVQVADSRVA